MTRSKPFAFLVFLLPALLFSGCSTDLDVNAPYKNITVVYGLLDANNVRHYIKINKAFLGDGDALLYALVPDSNEYQDGEITQAYVEDMDDGTQYPLSDTLIENRVTGSFYSPMQTIHYFDANLNEGHRYRLVVEAKGDMITSEAEVVDDLSYTSGFFGNSNLNLKQGQNYTAPDVKFRSGADGRRYDIFYRVVWSEERNDGTSQEKSLSRRFGTLRTNNLNGNEAMEVPFNGESFFETIGNAIPDDAGVTKRRFLRLDIYFETAGDDFTTYLRLADPVSGIVEERPEFTNISNGYGLFGSRRFKTKFDVKLGDDTKLELVTGQYTGDLLFCIDGSIGGTIGCD